MILFIIPLVKVANLMVQNDKHDKAATTTHGTRSAPNLSPNYNSMGQSSHSTSRPNLTNSNISNASVASIASNAPNTPSVSNKPNLTLDTAGGTSVSRSSHKFKIGTAGKQNEKLVALILKMSIVTGTSAISTLILAFSVWIYFPSVASVVDSFINSFCVYLSFKFAERKYRKLCFCFVSCKCGACSQLKVVGFERESSNLVPVGSRPTTPSLDAESPETMV